MRIWDTETYKFYYLCTHHTDDVATVAISPDEDSRIIATASWDQSINLYRLPERLYQPGKPEKEF